MRFLQSALFLSFVFVKKKISYKFGEQAYYVFNSVISKNVVQVKVKDRALWLPSRDLLPDLSSTHGFQQVMNFPKLNQHSAHILLKVHKTKLDQMVSTSRLSQGEPSPVAEAQVLDGKIGFLLSFYLHWGTWPPDLPPLSW